MDTLEVCLFFSRIPVFNIYPSFTGLYFIYYQKEKSSQSTFTFNIEEKGFDTQD
jgi:hypothetical protein